MNIKTKKELNLFLDNKKSKISIYEIWKQVKQATSELKIVIDNIPIANKMFIQGQEQIKNIKDSISISDNIPEPKIKYINNKNDSNEKEKWYYINGIATEQEEAFEQANELSKTFNKDIRLLYNETHGLISDLYESIKERTFKKTSELTIKVYKKIKRDLKNNKEVRLIGHSQGGIIASNVINFLVLDKDITDKLKNLHLYTFANAAHTVLHHQEQTEINGYLVPYSEHYINTKDFVAKIGVGAEEFRDNVSGDIYELDVPGHLLMEHYLTHFRKGYYNTEHKKGNLFKIMENNRKLTEKQGKKLKF